MAAGVHVPLRFLRAAMKKGISLLKTKITTPAQTAAKVLEPVYAQIPRQTSHIHPALRNKIGGRWYSTTLKTALRVVVDAAPQVKPSPSVRTAVVRRMNVASPFGSTLRPMLSGGAIPRTTSGYSLGGGARFFSHSPAAPAQIVSQVTAAMRAFLYNGKKNIDSYHRCDGKLARIGVRAQLAASLAQENAPGSYVDFDLSPTVTCISALNQAGCTLENQEFLEDLSADIDAMVGGLVAVKSDIARLSTLGDLPMSLVGLSGNVLRVHFRGCDREFVEKLCDEVGVKRGVVHEDERFTFGLFNPGAVSWQEMMSDDSPTLSSTHSEDGFEVTYSSGSENELNSKVTGSDNSVGEGYFFESANPPVMLDSPVPGLYSPNSSSNYSGSEGIRRFLSECEQYRNLYG
ncbi:hypothetical protein BZA77DRAFT_307062 [Pyronema omphalodes]|nr:hypothetical protein BZA77DRAFT_307062 [Pyronema omphalodes]